jgi:cytochrome c oxidase assembly protein subunit 15
MSLPEFKTIYYWEWAHRFWGRMIGIVFLVPFSVFWARGLLSRGLTIALLGIFALGGLQGGIGWFMVQSGLIDRPSVSHYRLALHLSCALLLYGLIIWTALTLANRSLQRSSISSFSWAFRIHALIGLGMVITTIIWGAFVAGLDAGLIYNEFPTMGTGRLVPAEIGHMTPYWINFFENHASVQFAHRWLGVSTVIMLLSLAAHGMLVSPPRASHCFSGPCDSIINPRGVGHRHAINRRQYLHRCCTPRWRGHFIRVNNRRLSPRVL